MGSGLICQTVRLRSALIYFQEPLQPGNPGTMDRKLTTVRGHLERVKVDIGSTVADTQAVKFKPT